MAATPFANSAASQFGAQVAPWAVGAMLSAPGTGAGPDTLTLTGAGLPGPFVGFNPGDMLIFCPPISVTGADGFEDSNVAAIIDIFAADVGGRAFIPAVEGDANVQLYTPGLSPSKMTLTLRTFTWNGVSPGRPIPTTTPSDLVFTVAGQALTAASPTAKVNFAQSFATNGVNIVGSALTTTAVYVDFA